MTPADELAEALSGKYRAVVIAERDVDLRPAAGENRLILLKIAEGSLAAGGRGGGFGERRIVRMASFESRGGVWFRSFETEDEKELSAFDVPFNVSRTPFTLSSGEETMGYGVIDQSLVAEYMNKVPRD